MYIEKTGSAVDEDDIIDGLKKVIDPCSKANGGDLNIVEMGLLKSIIIEGGDIQINMRLTTPTCMMIYAFMQQIEENVNPIPGVDTISLETDDGLQWDASMMDRDSDAVVERDKHLNMIEDMS